MERNAEMEKEEMEWLWLCSVPELTSLQKRCLLHIFRTPERIRTAEDELFSGRKRSGQDWVEKVKAFRRERTPEELRENLETCGVRFVSAQHPDYPSLLRGIPDYPLGLFYRGRLPAQDKRMAAVVGARACSGAGRSYARKMGYLLAGAGIAVVSGMAYGIDAAAQEGALQAGGESYAVLGCGVDVCYPQEHADLARRLTERGGLISEYPPGTSPLKHHFPARNRIISGLCMAVAVVEAREKSGSLITADTALDQGRDVYAMPGRWSDPLSAGCNRLIDQGAGLLLSPENLLEKLGVAIGAEKGKTDAGGKMPADEQQKRVFLCVSDDPKGTAQIAAEAGMSVGAAAALLVRLELLGFVREEGKGRYVRRS